MEGEAKPVPSVTPETLVGEIMTRNVLTARADTSVTDVVQIMARHKITGLPVIDESNHLIGVVSESDIIGKAGETVAEIMTNGSFTVAEDTTLGDAAEILLRRRIRRLPVVDGDNRLIGLLSRSDLIIFFAHHVWTCSWCGKGYRGFYAPSACKQCGGETFSIKVPDELEPAAQ
ncbi:MAG TPA: CBS domain-containing protein [Candidatus Dormibacteraeota bacterium]|jgi:CBS domain-containing protein|nr:CBS domain-containing protein [Candidatus Dormibacteraeota bacterium]